MKFVIPAFFIRHGKVGGAEQMLYNLIQCIASISNNSVEICLFKDSLLSPKFEEYIAATHNVWVTREQSDCSRFLAEYKFALGKKHGNDIVIYPNYHTPLFTRGAREVWTIIHDQQYIHFPHFFPRLKRIWLAICHKITLAMASKVVVISDFVKQDMLKTHGSKHAQKLHVIHNCINWPNDTGKVNNLPCSPYILAVAAHYPHKNLRTILQAFKQANLPGIKLILVGQTSTRLSGKIRASDNLETNITELKLTDSVSITGFVGDDELHSLYKNARLFLFPSVFEGFGMPPVEAMGYGIPVLTTRCASIPEVTKEQALYVSDPYDIGEWSSLIRKLMLDEHYYETELTRAKNTRASIKHAYSITHIAEKITQLTNEKLK